MKQTKRLILAALALCGWLPVAQAAKKPVVKKTVRTTVQTKTTKKKKPVGRKVVRKTTSRAVKTKSGLIIQDLRKGSGAMAKAGNFVTVHYRGTLTNGKQFDASYDRGQPFQFQLGAGQVIPGWDQGVAGMKEGGKRKLVIPPHLGYGARGAGNAIPPNATLVFEVELLKVG